jgi:hypothetical protein
MSSLIILNPFQNGLQFFLNLVFILILVVHLQFHERVDEQFGLGKNFVLLVDYGVQVKNLLLLDVQV